MSHRPIPDRRKHTRFADSGRIEIAFQDPLPVTIEAELVETSAQGFRATHECSQLVPGLEVNYQRRSAAGRARVIWTHILEGRRVSGFLHL